MQQVLLLLTTLLLGCGFPAFLIGFYSIRIWESRLRSFTISFVESGSSGSGREKAKSKRRKEKERDCRQEKADRLARETATGGKLSVSASLFSSTTKKIAAKSILGPKSTPVDVVAPLRVSVEGIPPSTIPDIVCPPVKWVTYPAASVIDASQPPLTIPYSAT
jgi:hypothetical protein